MTRARGPTRSSYQTPRRRATRAGILPRCATDFLLRMETRIEFQRAMHECTVYACRDRKRFSFNFTDNPGVPRHISDGLPRVGQQFFWKRDIVVASLSNVATRTNEMNLHAGQLRRPRPALCTFISGGIRNAPRQRVMMLLVANGIPLRIIL